MEGLRIEVNRDGWTKGIQISIDDDEGGFRLGGPKFNGSSKRLAVAHLDKRARDEIRAMLDRADAADASRTAQATVEGEVG